MANMGYYQPWSSRPEYVFKPLMSTELVPIFTAPCMKDERCVSADISNLSLETILKDWHDQDARTLDFSAMHDLEKSTQGRWVEMVNQYQWPTVTKIVLSNTDITEFKLLPQQFPKIEDLHFDRCKQLLALELNKWFELINVSLDSSNVEELSIVPFFDNLSAASTPLTSARIHADVNVGRIDFSNLIPQAHGSKYSIRSFSDANLAIDELLIYTKHNTSYNVNVPYTRYIHNLTINPEAIDNIEDFLSDKIITNLTLRYNRADMDLEDDLQDVENLKVKQLIIKNSEYTGTQGTLTIPLIGDLKDINILGPFGYDADRTLNIKLHDIRDDITILNHGGKYVFHLRDINHKIVIKVPSKDQSRIEFPNLPTNLEIKEYAQGWMVIPRDS